MPNQQPKSFSPANVRQRVKRHVELDVSKLLNGRKEDVAEDVAKAIELGLDMPEVNTLRDRLKGWMDAEEGQRFLEAVGFTDRDPVVFAHYGKSTTHFRQEPLADIEFDRNYPDHSWGVVMGISSAVPEDWQPEWTCEWDDRQQIYGAQNEHIAECRCLFLECDNKELSLEQQRSILNNKGLVSFTAIVDSGNRGGHFYLRLHNPVSPDQFRSLQKRLFKLLEDTPEFKVDRNLCNPSRVMRLPGTIHPKTGNRCRIVEVDTRVVYTTAWLEEILPKEELNNSGGVSTPVMCPGDANDALEVLALLPAEPTSEQLAKVEKDSYSYWLEIGMSLEWSGCTLEDWESWSRQSSRFQDGACAAKWGSFSDSGAKTKYFLFWLATQLGITIPFDPRHLKSPFFERGRALTQKIAEKIKHQQRQEKERLAGQPDWMRKVDWKVPKSITIERFVDNIFLKRAEEDKEPVVFFQNAFRRYNKKLGYYEALIGDKSMKKVISKILSNAYEGKDESKIYRYTKDHVLTGCQKWCSTTLEKGEEAFKPNKQAVAFRNGTAYWDDATSSWSMGANSADNNLTYLINCDLQLGAECPKVFREFVRTSYGLEYLEIIRAIIAYHVNPKYTCMIILFLLGPTGRGKGALLQMLNELVPVECRESIGKFAEIETHEQLAQKVYGRRMITFPDVNGKQTAISSLYRLVDAKERLSCRRLYSTETESFEFNGRVVAASTKPIQLDHAGSGLMRRLLTLKTREEVVSSTILPQDRQNSGKLEDLINSHMGEIVGWAMAMDETEVMKVLTKNDSDGVLKTNATEVASQADSVNIFMNCCLEPAEKDYKPDMGAVFNAYRLLCAHQGMHACNAKNLKDRLKEQLPRLYQPRKALPGTNSAKKAPAFFFGFKLLDDLWFADTDYSGKFTMSDEPFLQKSPNGRQSWGSLDTRVLSEDQYQVLIEHQPLD